MAKKTIIKLTEQDLHRLIGESVKQIIKEWDRDDWDEDPMDFVDQPEWDDITVWFNPETKQCETDEGNAEPGLWAECTVSVDNYHTENDGIGHYEFWGTPGYDEGADYGVVDSCSVNVEGWYQVTEDDMQPIENDAPGLSPEDEKVIQDFAIDMFEQK